MVAPFFEFNANGPAGVLRRLPDELAKSLRESGTRAGQAFQVAMTRSFRSYNNRASSSPDQIHSRSGKLEQSLGYEVSGTGLEQLRLKVFSAGVPYANIQERGGTITPKNAKFLTIPTFANLTPSGVPRFGSARDFIAQHPGETFFLRTEAAGREHLLLMWKRPGAPVRRSLKLGNSKAAKETAVPMFRLVKSAKIPPRFGFRRTWDALSDERDADFSRALKTAVRRAVGGG